MLENCEESLQRIAQNCAPNCARAPAAARRLHLLGDGLAVGVVGARREVADVELGEALEPAARDDAAQVVERRRRVEVALEEALRVPLALLDGVPVDVVALERHDLAVPLDDLRRLRARLAVLPRDPRDPHGALPRRLADDLAHLEEHAELPPQPVGLAVHEALGAVAALHDEALAARRRREQLLERVDLRRLHERRQLDSLSKIFSSASAASYDAICRLSRLRHEEGDHVRAAIVALASDMVSRRGESVDGGEVEGHDDEQRRD